VGLIEGERSSLFFEFARIADELVRPGGWLLFENVPGLLSSPGGARAGRDFAVVLATLADIGFHDLAWRVLDSRYFGVPQRRRRVYIVGRRASGDRARQVLLEPESGGGDFAPRREARTRVAASLASGSHGAGVRPPGRRQHDDENIVGALCGHKERGGWRIGADEAAAGQLVTGAIVKRYGKGTDSDATDALFVSALDRKAGGADDNDAQGGHLIAHTLRAEGFDASEDGTGRGTPLVAGTVRSHQRPGSNSSTDILCAPPDADGVRETPGLPGRVDTPADDYGQCWLCEWAEEHYAERGSGLDEWIEDFREAHRCSESRDIGPDGPRYSACGDAVTVDVAQWIGERIMRVKRELA
jgi:DNA (cytosine-5)-methyltransferase 1